MKPYALIVHALCGLAIGIDTGQESQTADDGRSIQISVASLQVHNLPPQVESCACPSHSTCKELCFTANEKEQCHLSCVPTGDIPGHGIQGTDLAVNTAIEKSLAENLIATSTSLDTGNPDVRTIACANLEFGLLGSASQWSACLRTRCADAYICKCIYSDNACRPCRPTCIPFRARRAKITVNSDSPTEDIITKSLDEPLLQRATDDWENQPMGPHSADAVGGCRDPCPPGCTCAAKCIPRVGCHRSCVNRNSFACRASAALSDNLDTRSASLNGDLDARSESGLCKNCPVTSFCHCMTTRGKKTCHCSPRRTLKARIGVPFGDISFEQAEQARTVPSTDINILDAGLDARSELGLCQNCPVMSFCHCVTSRGERKCYCLPRRGLEAITFSANTDIEARSVEASAMACGICPRELCRCEPLDRTIRCYCARQASDANSDTHSENLTSPAAQESPTITKRQDLQGTNTTTNLSVSTTAANCRKTGCPPGEWCRCWYVGRFWNCICVHDSTEATPNVYTPPGGSDLAEPLQASKVTKREDEQVTEQALNLGTRGYSPGLFL
ncbi:hypothetical protein P154DRAFT_524233 [Amniculicola lignicola CBS 123094]|uniref:Uncharacterized protein n=1 Tax=Amniculicola lignicola CBS 123094 TaxID=1392246 RepID=A0A6A5WAA8_9PLEO|nr:hypothetical protein P154DRAFT_524233 [Amniculicola lignicola CBS 123094]